MFNDSEDPVEWLARAERLKVKHKNGNGAGMPLAVAAKAWPTPAASDDRNRGTSESLTVARRVESGRQIMLTMSVPGALNPAWVEQLMGFPPGWTSPLTDGPRGPAKRSTQASRRASRKTASNEGSD